MLAPGWEGGSPPLYQPVLRHLHYGAPNICMVLHFFLIVPSTNSTFTVVANSHPGTGPPDSLSFWLLVSRRAAEYPLLLTVTPPAGQAARSTQRLSVLSLEATSGEKPDKCQAACLWRDSPVTIFLQSGGGCFGNNTVVSL